MIKGGIMTEEQAKLVGRPFQHFKGNLYRLEGFAKDSETLKEMVVYARSTARVVSGYAQPKCSSRPSSATGKP